MLVTGRLLLFALSCCLIRYVELIGHDFMCEQQKSDWVVCRAVVKVGFDLMVRKS